MKRVRTVDAAREETIAFLAWLVGWNGGGLPVYLDGALEPAAFLTGSPTELGRKLAARAAVWDLEGRQVEVGLPREQAMRYAGESTVLWATIESRESAHRCWKRFKPEPTMVLRYGAAARRLALWGLREPVPHVLAESGNRKIAYALGAPYKMVDPDKLRVPVPGTFLRVGRVRPAPVLVTRMELDSYPRSGIVGRLKDPPAPYMQRLREGLVKRG